MEISIDITGVTQVVMTPTGERLAWIEGCWVDGGVMVDVIMEIKLDLDMKVKFLTHLFLFIFWIFFF